MRIADCGRRIQPALPDSTLQVYPCLPIETNRRQEPVRAEGQSAIRGRNSYRRNA